MWSCPKCKRRFSRPHQRHACGTGDRNEVVRNRPPALVALYAAIESLARSLGPVEIVARERYVLFRSTRIFADLVIMTDAIRIAIHLGRKVAHPLFFKVAPDRRHISHVAKIRTSEEFDQIAPLLKEAYEVSLSIGTPPRGRRGR
jgi:hypothetical protein